MTRGTRSRDRDAPRPVPRREARRAEGDAAARGRHAAARTDNALVKALARAFRWKRMLESGEFATIAELAEREGIAPSYMTRVLRLTLACLIETSRRLQMSWLCEIERLRSTESSVA
jgi:hypothetical protein